MLRWSQMGVLVLAVFNLGDEHAWADAAPLYRCRQAFTKEAERYADKRRDYIYKCVHKLIGCELSLEHNGTNPTDCRTTAELWCARALPTDPTGYIGRAIAYYESHITRYCEVVDFADIVGGDAGQLWHVNDADCGTSADLDSLLACTRGEIEEKIDASFGDLAPRAGLLLDRAGVGGGLPNIPRPAITDVSVAATAPSSGTLISPGTVPTASGNAVRFIGDASTLPCGGGTNGDVTVTILTLGAACTDSGAIREQFTLHEPYGADRGVIGGPFSADATYCLELDDGSCDDTVTGTIDVP